jgi:hypothetical protein
LVTVFECGYAALEVDLIGAVFVECLSEFGNGLSLGFQLCQGLIRRNGLPRAPAAASGDSLVSCRGA